MIDNYDSFTFNLVQYLRELGASVRVFRHDAASAADIIAARPQGLILSPGPGVPDQAGICLDLVALAAETTIPMLGVCLGHQAIGQYFGGRVVRAPRIMHGKISSIHHCNDNLFNGLPQNFDATRYHSLVLDRPTLPAELMVTAETEDGIVMGVAHRDLPLYGVQFHPESIATAHGHDLLGNFLALAARHERQAA